MSVIMGVLFMDKAIRHIVQGIVLFLLVSMMSSCDDGGHYVVQNNTVVYTYWTFSFGHINDTLPDVDASSFKAVKDWLGHDGKHVFFKNELVQGIDVNTLKASRYPLYCDNRDYYYQTTPMHVTDMESFKVLKWFEDDFWAKDSHCVYYDTLRIDYVDSPSFKIIDMSMAKDKNHVYYFADTLPMADPASFEVIGNSIYTRDKSHVWCADQLLQDVDYGTFTVDDISTAHDKYGSFKWEKRDTLSQPD